MANDQKVREIVKKLVALPFKVAFICLAWIFLAVLLGFRMLEDLFHAITQAPTPEPDVVIAEPGVDLRDLPGYDELERLLSEDEDDELPNRLPKRSFDEMSR